MKIRYAIIGFSYLTTFFVGCDANSVPQQVEVEVEQQETNQSTLITKESADTHLFKIIQHEDQRVIECNHKHHIPDDNKAPGILAKHASEIAHNKYTYLINDQNIKNVTVRVDETVPTSGVDNWRNQVKKSLKNWNAVSGTKVFFQYTTEAIADITIQSDAGALPDYALGSAYYPMSNNTLQGVLRLNLDAMSDQPMSGALKAQIVSHELGHAIGMGHTNFANPSYETYIPGTRLEDFNSLMNTTTYLHTDSKGKLSTHILGFSKGDVDAVRLLYPDYSAALPWDNNKVYMFKGNTYALYDLNQNTVIGGHRDIEADWPGLTAHFSTIDAAIQSPIDPNSVFFFRGTKCIEYQKSPRQIKTGPMKTSVVWPGLGNITINAVINSPWNQKQLIFFSGKYFYKYIFAKQKLTKQGQQKIKGNWSDLTFKKIDFGFVSPLNKRDVFFFRNKNYSLYNSELKMQEPGFPNVTEVDLSGLY